MDKKIAEKLIAKGIATALKTVLYTEANATSSVVIYQPEAPKELSKYRITK